MEDGVRVGRRGIDRLDRADEDAAHVRQDRRQHLGDGAFRPDQLVDVAMQDPVGAAPALGAGGVMQLPLLQRLWPAAPPPAVVADRAGDARQREVARHFGIVVEQEHPRGAAGQLVAGECLAQRPAGADGGGDAPAAGCGVGAICLPAPINARAGKAVSVRQHKMPRGIVVVNWNGRKIRSGKRRSG